MADTSIYALLKPMEHSAPGSNALEAGMMAGLKFREQRNQEAQQKRQNSIQDEELARQKAMQHFDALGQALNSLAGMPEQERAQMYPQMREDLIKRGMISEDEAPPEYDSGFFRSAHGRWNQTASALELNKTRSEADYRKAEASKVPSEINKNNAEAYKYRKEADFKEGGKPLAAEQSDKLAGHDASLHMIGDLRQAIQANQNSFGPVAGRLSALNPYDTRAQSVSALFKKAAQTIGKSLEGGKLTDNDYAKYQAMLPNQNDTPDVANAKLDQLERMVTTQRNTELETYGRAGSNVGNFAKTNPPEIGVTRQAKGGGRAGEAVASAPAIRQGHEEDGYVFMGGDPANKDNWKRAR